MPPLEGVTPDTVGAGAYVTRSAFVAGEVLLAPDDPTVTVTSCVPVPGGSVTVSWVGDTTLNEADAPPTRTPVVVQPCPENPEPLTVTCVPPAAGPTPGETALTEAAGTLLPPLGLVVNVPCRNDRSPGTLAAGGRSVFACGYDAAFGVPNSCR
jgi:hypothetical protein